MFLYDSFSYQKSVYTIQAFRAAELPAAFEQMEKLRTSGYLAGFIRRAALFPEEHRIPENPEVPLLMFFLFRGRGPLPKKARPKRVFCPAMSPVQNGAKCLCAVAPQGAPLFARELRTACSGRDIFAMLSPDYACSGYFQNAWEEILCLGSRKVVNIDRTARAQEENPAPEPPMADLLRSGFAGGELLLMGCFARDRVEFSAADVLMTRRSAEGVLRVMLSPAAMGGDPDKALKDLCVPPETRFTSVTRLEKGAVFLLKEHLERLKALAKDHEVDSAAVDAAAGQIVPAAPLPLPGRLADLGLAPELCWSALPKAWRTRIKDLGLDPDGAQPLALTLVLEKDGTLGIEAAPVAERQPVLGYVRQALDERNDLLSLDLARPLPHEEAAARRIADGQWQDALVVGRFAVVAGCAYSDLAFRQGAKLLTPPAGTGLRDGVLRHLLLSKKILQERGVSLAQVVSSQELYCLSSVHGALSVTKADPDSLDSGEAVSSTPSAETASCCQS